ncbi:MAG: hypothetical protein ACYC0X_23450 [Pirellulaceae bacterium]
MQFSIEDTTLHQNLPLSGQRKTTLEMMTMSSDPTETVRCERLAEINSEPGSRDALAAQYGQVWSTQELGEDFQVLGFMAPFVVVRRKSDGIRGSLEFQHTPRFYFNFQRE